MSDSTPRSREGEIFDLFDQPGYEPLTTSEIATKAGCSHQTAHNKLDALVEQGLLQTKEVGGGGRVWWPPVHEREQDESEERHASNLVERAQSEKTRRESQRRFQEMIDELPEAIYTTDVDGRLTYFNPAAVELSGRTPELGTDEWCVTWKLFEPDGTPMPHDECPMAVAMKEGRSIRGAEAIAERPDGTRIRFEAYPSPLRDDDGQIVGGINMLVGVTERKRTERLQEEQTRLLELIASGTPLEECLSALCDAVPRLNPGVRASTLLADENRETFDRHIAPDVFPPSSENFEGAPINELAIGTCGEAVFRGTPVTSKDIENDERWSKDWRELCMAHDVRACHSEPVMDSEGQPIASFMLCFDEPREPNEWEQRLADFGTHVMGIALERDRSRKALREREEHLSALIETTPECIKTVAPDGSLLQMNPAGLSMVEADSASSVIGECVYDLIAPEHREMFREFNEQVCGGERETLQFDIIGLEGTRRHMETHAAPLRSPDGTTTQVALTRDITEQVERERELERALDLLEKTERIADVGGWEIDPETTEVFWTEHLFELLEVDADEEPPLDEALEVYHEDDRPVVESAVEEAIDSGDPFDVEVRFRTPSDEVRWLRVQGEPETVDGETVSLRGAAQDVTERKQREERLEKVIDRLEESNERLEQFAYAASHDLQEPLRMVSTYLQLIEDRYEDALDEDGQEFFDFAVDGADRMRSMIQGLLKYSRIEKRGDSFEPTDLDAILADVREDLQLRIEESDADITADSLPRVDGDEEQLRQVFQNLLDNAIEYSGDEPPQVDVSAERDGGEWTVSVSDEGVGIDSDDADRVFEVFQRLHTHEEHSGTGIGLALCERIVERHGGDIRIESDPGEGSTFSFTLPAASDQER